MILITYILKVGGERGGWQVGGGAAQYCSALLSTAYQNQGLQLK